MERITKLDKSVSIQNRKIRNVSIAAAGEFVFPYGFKVLAQSDLQIQVNGVDKIIDVDFTVSGVAEENGGKSYLTSPWSVVKSS